MLLIGEADTWTPAEPCRQLVSLIEETGGSATLVTYPNAVHEFDHPDRKPTADRPRLYGRRQRRGDGRDRSRRARRRVDARAGLPEALSLQDASLSPAIPARIRPMQASRSGSADSEKRMIPRIAVPIVPMPVQTA